jgi:hypothetical protein
LRRFLLLRIGAYAADIRRCLLCIRRRKTARQSSRGEQRQPNRTLHAGLVESTVWIGPVHAFPEQNGLIAT